MNGKKAKEIRRMAVKQAEHISQQKMVPEFKAFVNTQLTWWERVKLAWRIIWKRF